MAKAVAGAATDPSVTIDLSGTAVRTAGRPSILEGKPRKKLSKSYRLCGSKCYIVVYSGANKENQFLTKRKALK
jgi:hypothetical protein